MYSIPVGQAEGEELEAGWLEEEVPVPLHQVAVAGDPLTEPPDHVDGGGEDGVELNRKQN